MNDEKVMNDEPSPTPQEMPLIAVIVGGLGLAFVFGAVADRLRVPPRGGHLLAGVLFGPHPPGFVPDREPTPKRAGIGVISLAPGARLQPA